MDKKFASLVNKNTCLEIAKNIKLENFIQTFNPKNKSIKIEDKIISDCCEALVGAIYLEKGLGVVEKLILDLWQNHIKRSDWDNKSLFLNLIFSFFSNTW